MVNGSQPALSTTTKAGARISLVRPCEHWPHVSLPRFVDGTFVELSFFCHLGRLGYGFGTGCRIIKLDVWLSS